MPLSKRLRYFKRYDKISRNVMCFDTLYRNLITITRYKVSAVQKNVAFSRTVYDLRLVTPWPCRAECVLLKLLHLSLLSVCILLFDCKRKHCNVKYLIKICVISNFVWCGFLLA